MLVQKGVTVSLIKEVEIDASIVAIRNALLLAWVAMVSEYKKLKSKFQSHLKFFQR